MKQKNLWLMVGCAASGKSTWLTKNACSDGVIVSRDAIRFSLLNPGDDYFSKENEVFEKYVNSIQNAFNHTDNVYADATHLTEASRNKLLNRLDLTNVNIKAVMFLTSLDECLARNSKRGGRAQVPESVIKRMFFSTTDPTFDKKYKIETIYVGDDNNG